jgi:hypothetical protein
MVTEQVKRMRATLRTCGFTTRDFSVQAERKTEGRRNGQRGHTVFGRAAGITKNRDAAKRAFDARFDLRNAGLTVQVYERDGTVSFVSVRDPDHGYKALIVRHAHTEQSYYEEETSDA